AEFALTTPAPDTAGSPPLAALPAALDRDEAARRRTLAAYAHALDFTWLQGVLTHEGPAGWCLRFTDPTRRDLGPVSLDVDDPGVFESLRPGDIVVAEGEFTAAPARYRARVVRLAERPAP